MFLTFLTCEPCVLTRVALLAVIGLAASAQPTRTACFVELPVYDAQGNRLHDFEISGVFPEGNSATDLLTARDSNYRVTSSGDRVYFPVGLIGKRRLEITLRNGKGVKIVRRVALTSCEQRNSVEHGMSDTGAEVSTTTVRGRVSGCKLDSHWWIHAFPMFGATETPAVHEGVLRPSDGGFAITSGFNGERHILVVGKDTTPVTAVGINVIRGGTNDAGTIDLRGLCPDTKPIHR